MKVLELFSGTGSVGNACREFGFEVISLDRDMEADIKADIMDWDYIALPPNISTWFGHHLPALNTASPRREASGTSRAPIEWSPGRWKSSGILSRGIGLWKIPRAAS